MLPGDEFVLQKVVNGRNLNLAEAARNVVAGSVNRRGLCLVVCAFEVLPMADHFC